MLQYESQYYGIFGLGSNELYHHGIKGMKWGVRRYQNEDGSLTAAGAKRYGTVDNFNKANDYKKGLRRATIEGGLIGRAMYKHKNEAPQGIKKQKEQHSDEYKKGLRRATIEGGLIGRAMYKHKNSDADLQKESKPQATTKKKQSQFTSDGKMKINNTDTGVTRKVKKDYNELDDKQFFTKYQTSKKQYAKRVEKYGDPYAHRMGNSNKSKAKAAVDLRQIESQVKHQEIAKKHITERVRATAVANVRLTESALAGKNQASKILSNYETTVKRSATKAHNQHKAEMRSYKEDVAAIRKKYK